MESVFEPQGATKRISVTLLSSLVRPIRNQDDYRVALTVVDQLTDAEPCSEEARFRDVLSELIFAYEERNLPGASQEALESIKVRMNELGLTCQDLDALLRAPVRMVDVLEAKKPLTLQMMKTLHQHLNIPADLLLSS